jgi:hypothetical protein
LDFLANHREAIDRSEVFDLSTIGNQLCPFEAALHSKGGTDFIKNVDQISPIAVAFAQVI